MDIPPEVAAGLGHYVYLYIDPRCGTVKYAGKGVGTRAAGHGAGKGETEKESWLTELKNAGMKPRIDILARNLTEEEALLVERSVIDAIGIPPLTNKVRGHGVAHGRESLEEIIIKERAKNAVIRHKVICFRLNKYFKTGMSGEQIYEGTRGVWVIGAGRRKHGEYAFAVVHGIVRGVYEIQEWHKAGSTPYKYRPLKEVANPKRWEFTGTSASSEIMEMYLHKSVRNDLPPQGAQNPVSYAGDWKNI